MAKRKTKATIPFRKEEEERVYLAFRDHCAEYAAKAFSEFCAEVKRDDPDGPAKDKK